jgi:sulfite reductase alpha subunit-like flavoprotein
MSVILYATEQGASQEVAEKIGQATGIEVVDAKTVKAEDLTKYTKIVWVVSSYGRGAAPSEYREWWETVNALTADLSAVSFAVFGCGSSNYKRSFVGFAKAVEAKMLELGAKKITEMGILDDTDEKSTDLDAFISPLK